MAADQRPLPGARCPPRSERRSQPCGVLKAAGTRALLSPHQKAPPCPALLRPADARSPRAPRGRRPGHVPGSVGPRYPAPAADSGRRAVLHLPHSPRTRGQRSLRVSQARSPVDGTAGRTHREGGGTEGPSPKTKPSRERGTALPPPLLRDAWGASGQDAGTHCARGLVRWEQRWVVAATGRGGGAQGGGGGGRAAGRQRGRGTAPPGEASPRVRSAAELPHKHRNNRPSLKKKKSHLFLGDHGSCGVKRRGPSAASLGGAQLHSARGGRACASGCPGSMKPRQPGPAQVLGGFRPGLPQSGPSDTLRWQEVTAPDRCRNSAHPPTTLAVRPVCPWALSSPRAG